MSTTLAIENLDFNKVWFMFQETDRKFQETDRKFQETDKQLKETRSILDQMFQETEKIVQKTSRAVRNLSKQMKESESRWGRFVEALVEGALVRILNDFGINVKQTSMRVKCILEDDNYEIDIIAKNGIELVAIEVKTTLRVSDVQDFMEKLKLFKKAFPDYERNKLYGGVAYIQSDGDANKFAAKNGLIVIKAVGDSAIITNRSNFKPKCW